jgi:2-polyprenyl-6-methoxyphenol hydroxylase-like FAD-dependent oxidoreductase
MSTGAGGGVPPGILVVGGGIGGLTTALALHAAGIDCTVVEKSRELRPLGVGINLLPHAVRELSELGLGDRLAATAVPTAHLAYHDRFGCEIWREPRGEAAGYRWPQYSIHRGALMRMLLEAVRARLGPNSVRTGLALEGLGQTGGRVRASLRNRTTGGTEVVVASVLVGADGIRSAVRARLYPDEGPPRWNGIVMWRGVTEAEPFLGGRTMIMAGSNQRAKFVAYPISRATEQRGRSMVNWVAEVRTDRSRSEASPDWNRLGRVEDVLAHFAGWRFDWLDVPQLVRDCETVLEYPMVDRDPLDRWSFDRVTLLGDAAHPMYPIGSNGASQAIIDARVLAWHLATATDSVSALAAYDDARRPVTNALVIANRDQGPERVLRLVEERAPTGFSRIEDVISRPELEAVAAGYKRVAGFDVGELNRRPSWDAPQRATASP